MSHFNTSINSRNNFQFQQHFFFSSSVSAESNWTILSRESIENNLSIPPKVGLRSAHTTPPSPKVCYCNQSGSIMTKDRSFLHKDKQESKCC